MQFLILVNIDEALIEALPDPEYDALMRGCLRHADALKAQGTLVMAQQLESPASARTLRARDGEERVTDGPFAETRELLAGFNLVNARDLDTFAQFAREVRAEARKITWTSRQETWITSVMVAIMVILAALFFAAVNWICSHGIALILKLATGA